MFSAQAEVLGGDKCINSTGVGGVAIESVTQAAANSTSNTTTSTTSGAVSLPMAWSGKVVVLAAVGISALVGLL